MFYKKRLIKCFVLVIVSAFIWLACSKSKSNASPPTDNGTATVTYTESTDDFPNPERGFYRYTEGRASAYIPLVETQLQQWRGLMTANGGNYQVYSTIIFRYFILDIFKSSILSASFLQSVKNDFDIARAAGVKLIPRFVYTTTATSGSCPESFNCPPYGDAPKNIVLQHLAQLKPVLAASADVIAVVQMGLIGTWGENYYTDYFGDGSQNGQSKLLDNNWQDRNEIISALLDAVPADRMIQVRTPQAKQRFVYGINATVAAAPMTEAEAFTGIDKARIGFHNDCFLAGADDYGTYDDYGNSSSPRQSANTVLRAFKKADSKYVAVGGETCDDTYSPQNDCEPAGMAETEMANYHYSYLNCSYNNAVNNDWQTNGCMLNIRKKLGYRFVLKNGVYPSTVQPGSALKFTINLENKGYASPFNARPLKLIMRKENSTEEFVFDLPDDVRKWYSGAVKIDASVPINSTMSKGKYELFLFLPDKYSTIAERPEYAIRLANEDIWEANTGYNKLMATVTVR